MSEEQKRAEIVRYWWGRAHTSLQAARREAAAGDYPLAINRAYYALFYAETYTANYSAIGTKVITSSLLDLTLSMYRKRLRLVRRFSPIFSPC